MSTIVQDHSDNKEDIKNIIAKLKKGERHQYKIYSNDFWDSQHNDVDEDAVHYLQDELYDLNEPDLFITLKFNLISLPIIVDLYRI